MLKYNDKTIGIGHVDLSGKVDKVEGKDLSTNDYDNTDKAKVDAVHCDIGNVRIGEVEDTTLGEHAHLMGFTSNSKADPVIRYINYKEDGKTSSERLLLSYESSTEDLLIKGNANDKYTEFRLSDYAKTTDVDNKADKSEVPTLLLKNATLIPDNADLNDYHDIGEFYIPSATNAATMTNAPWSDSGCKITIDDNYSGSDLRFMTAQAAPGKIAQRHYSYSSGAWGWSEWRYIYETRDTYSSTSPWAMSGKAVASAISTKMDRTGGTFTGNVSVNKSDGTAGTAGASYLTLGNKTLVSADKNSRGRLDIYGTGNPTSGATQEYAARIQAGALTGTRTYTLGDRSGEVAVRDAAIDVSGAVGTNITKYGAIICAKTNGLCTVIASLSCNAAIAQGATIITLPSGFRPKAELGNFPVFMTTSAGAPVGQAVVITTAGKVMVNNSCASGSRIYMTLTFLV